MKITFVQNDKELSDFVRRLLDANREFDGFTEDDVAKLKEVYGV